MASNLLSQGVPPESSTGDGRGSVDGGGRGAGGDTRVLQEEGPASGLSYGPQRLDRRNRRLPYELLDALVDSTKYDIVTTSNSVMPIKEASQRLNGLFVHCGLGGSTPGLKYAFHMAILLANAKNSSSIAQPNRAIIQVSTMKTVSFHEDVLAYLGNDSRRFFRAYAEESMLYQKQIRAKFQAGDEEYRSDVEELDFVARSRGLERYPHLVHDGAEYCPGLTSAEYAAIQRSKAIVLSNTTNVVDSTRVYNVPSSSRVETPVQDVAADVPY